MEKFFAGCAFSEGSSVTMDYDHTRKLHIDIDNVVIGADAYLSESKQEELYEWLGKALGK